MSRRLLVKGRLRLEASFLPLLDPVRLELETELIDRMAPTRVGADVVLVDEDDDAHASRKLLERRGHRRRWPWRAGSGSTRGWYGDAAS
jgi:hypothetical protein